MDVAALSSTIIKPWRDGLTDGQGGPRSWYCSLAAAAVHDQQSEL